MNKISGFRMGQDGILCRLFSSCRRTGAGCVLLGALLCATGAGAALNPAPPPSPVKLIFIHHSTGENWLADGNGALGLGLMHNNYFVSDTNYGWGPDGIGDTTDIGHWYTWFLGPARDTYMNALFSETAQASSYTRMAVDPGGDNRIILFKSCFPNSNISGNPNDPPTVGANPLRGQDAGSMYMTVANVKGIYADLLSYFAAHQDKLFVLIVPPPLAAGDTDTTRAANARAVANWLVTDWLDGYPARNVAVFDFYNVLTSNGGDANTNDAGAAAGNHHRYRNGAIDHSQSVAANTSAYPSGANDSHPTSAGNQKATAEFPALLNIWYHCWQGTGSCPEATPPPPPPPPPPPKQKNLTWLMLLLAGSR